LAIPGRLRAAGSGHIVGYYGTCGAVERIALVLRGVWSD
jgi:hypothetical protein